MKIVCLGDSFTQGFLVEKSYVDYLKKAGYHTINMGRNGDMTGDLLARFKPSKCDLLIIFAGTNDLLNGVSADIAFENIKEILKMSRADTNLIIIPPYIEEDESYMVYEMVNRSIDAYGDMIKGLTCPIIDARKIPPSYFIDGIHMREDFHKRLAQEIIKNIENI